MYTVTTASVTNFNSAAAAIFAINDIDAPDATDV
jgi:hypothetical protein